MDQKRKVVMCDMDGTLSNSKWRGKWSPKNGGSWEKFHRKCYQDLPITRVLDFTNELSLVYDIAISTARPYYVEEVTIHWLRKLTNFGEAIVMMRGDHQYELKSPELKLLHLEILKDSGREVAFIIDDRKDVCEAFINNGVPALLVNNKKII